MKTALKAWVPPFDPARLPNNAARYSLDGTASDTTFRIDASVPPKCILVADRSGQSAVNGLVLNGVSGNYASSPDSVATSITGNIDIRVLVQLQSWTPASPQIAVGKYTSAGSQKSYYLQINATGALQIGWSANGSSDLNSVSSVSTGFAAFSPKWIRATLQVNDGAGNNVATFYSSDDGVTWTQLGTTITTAGTTGIFDSTAPVSVGGVNAGTASLATGIIYRAQIYNGINGTLAFDANFTTVAKLATSFAESSVNAATVTINTSGDTGARICGARDLVQMTSAKMPNYLAGGGSYYGYINGLSGTTFSTPDSSAISITGDISLVACAALNDWTPSAYQALIGKYDYTINQRSYELGVNTNGTLLFSWSLLGVSDLSATSTVAPTIADGATLWVRVDFDVDNGALGRTATFYTSANGVTWSQLGSPVTSATATNIFDSTASLYIGADNVGANNLASGKFYRAQVFNGMIASGGVLAFDFNPQVYRSGATFLDSSANAATITINGGAMVVTNTGLNHEPSATQYLKSAPYSASQPRTRYTVFKDPAWTSGRVLWDGNAAGSAQLLKTGSTPNVQLNAGSAGPQLATYLLQGVCVCVEVINGASSYLQRNRDTAGTVADAGATAPNGTTMGSDGAGANPASLFWVERLERTVVDPPSVIAQIVNFYVQKYRMPLP